MLNIIIPDFLNHLPTHRGFPITYVTFVGLDGEPDFKVVDEIKRKRCLTNDICGICGKKLNEAMVFIGGPLSIKARSFIDPAMHIECAMFAAKTCPYLANSMHDYSKANPKHIKDDDIIINRIDSMSSVRPTRLGLYFCRGFNMERVNGMWHAKAKKAFKIDWNVCK